MASDFRGSAAAMVGLALACAHPGLAAAADEVVMRISAQGTAQAQPDKVTLTGTLTEAADSEAAARSAFAAHGARIRGVATQAGLDGVSVSIAEPKLRHAAPALVRPPPNGSSPSSSTTEAKAAEAVTASGKVEIAIDDPAKLATVQGRLSDLLPNTTAKASLVDDRQWHEAAVANAVARARADANLYAASLGFHIVRVRSVSNDGSIDVSNVVKIVQTFSNGGPGLKSVPVFASVRIEYVIAPN